jgi:hypothetical protein
LQLKNCWPPPVVVGTAGRRNPKIDALRRPFRRLFFSSDRFLFFKKGGPGMKPALFAFLAVTAVVGICILPAVEAAEIKPPAEGGVLPSIDLGVPQSPEHQQYLGVTGKTSFTIPEIKAEVVLIEIFSMY